MSYTTELQGKMLQLKQNFNINTNKIRKIALTVNKPPKSSQAKQYVMPISEA